MNENQKPALIIEFDGFGSAHFVIGTRSENDKISPMQLFAVAEYLKFKATNMLAEQEYIATQKRMSEQIQVAQPGTISNLRKH